MPVEICAEFLILRYRRTVRQISLNTLQELSTVSRACGLMVEYDLAKVVMRVRFPPSASARRGAGERFVRLAPPSACFLFSNILYCRMGGKYGRFDLTEYTGLFPPHKQYLNRFLDAPSETLVRDEKLKDINRGLEIVIYVIGRDVACGLSPRGKQYPYLADFRTFCFEHTNIKKTGLFLQDYAKNVKSSVEKLQRQQPVTQDEKDTLRALMAYVVTQAKKQEQNKRITKRVSKPSRMETSSRFQTPHIAR